MNPSYIIVHHSLTEDNDAVSWDAIREYHMKFKGWKDIGYHYGIERIDGVYYILKGRMDNEEGAHCLGFNDKSIGICVIGDFDRQPPAEEQLLPITRLCRSLMDIYGIKAENVLGHRETYSILGKAVEKTCPGKAWDMSEFRQRL